MVDIGGGTTDIAVLEYRQGVFHQIAAASGDGYLSGLDFTNAVAQAIAAEHDVAWDDVYGEGGVNLAAIPPQRRPFVMGCWFAGEEAKKHLSVLEEATVAVESPEGRKAFTITRTEAQTLWQPLVERFQDSIAQSLAGTEMTFGDIDHPMLGGGSSRVPGLWEAMARVMGRDPSDVLVCTDSERIVSSGAAEHGFHQDHASQSLGCGLGVTVFDRDAERHRHLLLIPPGQILPPEGLFIERHGLEIGVMNGCSTLVCKPFVCRSGVRATVVDGRDTFLEDTEIIRLQEVQADLDDFPPGEHTVAVGVKADPNRKLWLLCRSITRSAVEPLSIPLVMEEGQDSAEGGFVHLDILLLLDCSKSMAKWGKIDRLRQGALKFAQSAVNHSANLGIIALPESPQDSTNERARVACDPSQHLPTLEAAIQPLIAGGGTPLHAALDLAAATFPQRGESAERIAVLFTDGMPFDPDRTRAAAETLKQSARLITVGIGEDVVEPLLRELASDAGDYFFAEGVEAIFDSFVSVTELIWNDGRASLADADVANGGEGAAQ